MLPDPAFTRFMAKFIINITLTCMVVVLVTQVVIVRCILLRQILEQTIQNMYIRYLTVALPVLLVNGQVQGLQVFTNPYLQTGITLRSRLVTWNLIVHAMKDPLPLAMLVKASLTAEAPLTLPAPLVGKDFISLMMAARMYALHGLIAPVLLVTSSPVMQPPIPRAHPALMARCQLVALQQHVSPRLSFLAPLEKDSRTGEIAQTTHVHHA